MTVVWKIRLIQVRSQSLDLPAGSVPLSVQWKENDEGPVLWVICDPEAPKLAFPVTIYGTGQPIEDVAMLRHLGTYQDRANALAWHVFGPAVWP